MKCRRCKTVLEKSDVFCPRCGLQLKRRRKKLFYFLLVLFLTATVVFIGIFLYCRQQKEHAEKAVTEFLESYRRADGQTCGKLLYNNFLGVPIEFSETEGLLAKGINNKIVKCQYKNGIMCITVEIENIDFQQVFEALVKQQNDVTEEELNNQISKEQEKNENRKVFECNIFLYKVEDEWKLDMTDELSNALHGGMNEYIDSLISGEEGK